MRLANTLRPETAGSERSCRKSCGPTLAATFSTSAANTGRTGNSSGATSRYSLSAKAPRSSSPRGANFFGPAEAKEKVAPKKLFAGKHQTAERSTKR